MSQSHPPSPLESESLAPTRIIDSDHPSVREFAAARTAGATTPVERAVRLYYAVRDGFRYDPYHFDMSEAGLKASQVVESGRGFCVPKATLLAEAARVLHGFIAPTLFLLILLHVGAAFYHQLALKDNLLSRMWYGK